MNRQKPASKTMCFFGEHGIKKPLAIVLVLLTVLFYGCGAVPAAAFKFGSSGDEVKEIQQRLKDWGYYDGEVDGYYGKATEDAVIAFQIKHKIRIDGIVGEETAEKLGISLPSGGGTGGSGDVYLLAQLVYAEARGESYTGKVAVAAVVLNRIESSLFPNSMAKVIYQRGAFSVVDDGQINLAPDQESLKAARDALNGWDPSGGALFYYNPSKTSNAYILSRPVICTIGNHVFCK
ncbi:MAG: spore cortex-lytic enzyme [Eubacteriales bacterium]|nr:spore cortex-lytic enzyme [Eubacteriales bacterium]